MLYNFFVYVFDISDYYLNMNVDPLKQFKIANIFEYNLFAKYGIYFTNSAFMMLILVIIFVNFYFLALKRSSLIPSRLQISAELLFALVDDSLTGLDTKIKKIFAPIIFSIFLFILISNLLGNIPYSFTITSHISVTLCISLAFFVFMTYYACLHNGKEFLRLFFPSRIPYWIMPLISLIEIFSYLSKPFVLCLRLTINVVAGHIMIKIVASLMDMLLIYFGILTIPLLSILLCFEILISILQAYIFMILSCTYLKDVLSAH